VTRLPLLLSVPHAGTVVAPEVREICLLTLDDIERDGDEGAAEIYRPLEAEVTALVTTPIARAIVDQNRAADDFSYDGVLKTHTCWRIPIYRRPLTEDESKQLLDNHYRPYHAALVSATRDVLAGIDCHTMAAVAPPVAPDAGRQRPLICLGNDHGRSCPDAWFQQLATSLARCFDCEAALNKPFAGGHITRSRPGGIPWMQLEMSRDSQLSLAVKREKLHQALWQFCQSLRPGG
jgi:N-formylglutamate deformylase